MDSRLADQLVEWHNRHPLARHISIFDVHTLGVVALPFMRSGRPAAHIEPGFAPEGAVTAPAGEHPDAASADAPAAGAARSEPFAARPGLGARLRSLLAKRPRSQQGWPLFNERFINRLSPRRVARFALAHGHSSPPGAADWPQRSIEIDEDLMARTAGKAAGAWPIELYLMTAGIDAGPARTRVLMAWGSGQQLLVLGRRCLDPRKLGLALLATALLAAGALALVWALSGKGAATDEPAAAASAPAAASSASGVLLAASAPGGAASGLLAPAASAVPPIAASAASAIAEAAASAASALPAEAAASQAVAGAASGIPFAPATQGIPDIRPRLKPVTAARGDSSPPADADKPPAPAEPKGKAADKPKEKAAAKPAPESETAPAKAKSSSAAPPKSEGKGTSRADDKPDGRKESRPSPSEEAPRSTTPGKALGELPPKRGSGSGSPAVAAAVPEGRQVALVGPSSPSKAQAEATLARMRSLLGQTVRDPDQLQAQVFQTKDGWRPAVWPFASREQAQLVNATLIASGLRTRAVDF